MAQICDIDTRLFGLPPPAFVGLLALFGLVLLEPLLVLPGRLAFDKFRLSLVESAKKNNSYLLEEKCLLGGTHTSVEWVNNP